MAKINEIKKITKNIKEIAPAKTETLEEEVEDEEIMEESPNFNFTRRRNANSTLAQTEIPQEMQNRKRMVEKEDDAEINFKPSYSGGGNPYRENKYTPVGSAESGTSIRSRTLGEQTLNRQDEFIQRQEEFSQNDRSTDSSERTYASQQNHQERERRKRNM